MMKVVVGLMRNLRRARHEESGAVLAEIAIVLPIMFLLFAAATEFGLYFYTYTTLDKATRVGARYISSKSFNVANKAMATNLVLCGNEAGCSTGSEVMPGLTAANIQITGYCKSGPCADSLLPGYVKVEIVNFNYQPILDLGVLTGGAAWADVPVTPSTTMQGTLTD